jgi:LacI family transcriptional regulator
LGADNNVTLSDCLSVPLSTIDTNLKRVGYEGAALLDRLMSGEQPPDGPVYVPPAGIVQRRSTDMLAVEHAGVAAALEFIQAQHHRNLSVPEIAGAVAMSRSGLEKAFRDYYVRPPAEELRRARLEHAKAMLRDTDEKIAGVARATGFQTSQNLCRVFRRSIGTTPKQYRMMCAESRAAP